MLLLWFLCSRYRNRSVMKKLKVTFSINKIGSNIRHQDMLFNFNFKFKFNFFYRCNVSRHYCLVPKWRNFFKCTKVKCTMCFLGKWYFVEKAQSCKKTKKQKLQRKNLRGTFTWKYVMMPKRSHGKKWSFWKSSISTSNFDFKLPWDFSGNKKNISSKFKHINISSWKYCMITRWQYFS